MVLVAGYLQAQDKTKYKTGSGDGYDGSKSEVYIERIFQEEKVCEGDDALFSMQVEGSMLYSYRWYKVGAKSTTLSTESFLLIKKCQLKDNGTKYMCEVTDLNSNEMVTSRDTFRLEVLTRPVAKLSIQKDTTLCYGQTLKLSVSPTGTDYVYTWFGDGIVGDAAESQVTVKPTENTRYEVTVGNRVCVSDSVGIQINIVRPGVKLPEDIIYTQSGNVLLTPEQDGTFDWNTSYGASASGQKTFTVSMSEALAEATVTVVSRAKECSVSDSVKIVNELALFHYVGGTHDGFIESQQKLSVSGITPILNEVCYGEEAFFTCNVDRVGTYTYQWYRIVDDKSYPIGGAESNQLIVETDDMANSGKYYCVVHDLDTKQTKETDPATLTIVERPEVEIITEDVAICKGETTVLKADRGADAEETFRWNGVNIQTNPTYQEITVAPTEKAVYQLVAKRGQCMVTKEVTVNVNEVQVNLPDVVDILRGEDVVSGFAKEIGVSYTWSMKGGSDVTGDTLRFTPEENTIVRVEKNLGSCTASDSMEIYLKEYGVGLVKDMPEDGYAESVLPFYIMALDCPQRLCIGDEAIMNIEVKGYDVYQYTWKKRNANGTEVVVDSVKEHRITSAKKSDAGVYFCEVTNVANGEMRASDEVTLEVLEKPIAEIGFIEPALGYSRDYCWICAGETVELETNRKDGWAYLWEGLGLLGDVNEPQISAMPEESCDVSLVVSNGVCSDVAYVRINVQAISVDIPEVLFVPEGEAFVVEPVSEVAAGATLEWSYNNGAKERAAKYTSNGVTQSGYLTVTMDLDGCEAYDSTRIYVRGFNTFQGGTEDGFIESNSSFLIQELRYPSMICENEDVDFSVRVRGSGVYLYAWKQVGNSETLSSEASYSLAKCGMDRAGEQYYCLVTDLMLGKTLCSDTATLKIQKGPKAVINYPERGKSYCSGASIRLDARQTEEYKETADISYVYSWEGEAVTETEFPYAVDVRPTQTQVYTLKVSADNCSAYDTIQIYVIDPRISIPSVIYAEENKALSIEATVSNASIEATVNWWHNALFIPHVNPYIITDIAESANIVAEVVDRGCKTSDTARVYVRTSHFFAGGDDDGFMESCNIPEIRPDVPTVLGCGGVDSVEMNVAYNGDPKVFVWQRYDKGTGKFVALEESTYLSGLGTPNLKIKPLTEAFYGQYRCVLTNDCGSTYSLVYKVSNGNAPEVVAHADTVKVCEGVKDHQILMVLKADDKVGDVNYRWYKKNPVTGVVVQFTPEASFNKQAYVIPEVTPEYDAYYMAEAEGMCGTAKDSVRLIVSRKVSFRVQPSDTLVCYDTSVSLFAYSQDGGICSYSLKKVIPDKSVFEGFRVEKICKGNGSNRYDFKPISMEDGGYYVWTVRSSCGDSVTSRMFKVTVEKPVRFISQTPDTTVCVGTNLTLDVKAESPDCPDSKITYAWDKLGEGRLTSQAASLGLSVVATTGGGYLCSATNVCGTENLANPIEVAVHPQLVVTKNPVWANAGICEEAALELDFAVNSTEIVDSIRWFRRSSGVDIPVRNELTRISGADDYKLKVDSLRLDEAGLYYARIYNVCGTFETVRVDIQVYEKAKIVNPIADYFNRDTVCYGEEADLKVTAVGYGTLMYWWEKNSRKVADSSANQLRVQFDEDAMYRCIVYNHCAQASSEWSVKVVRPDTFRLKAVDAVHYCEGEAGVALTLGGSDPECTYSLYRQESSKATPVMVGQLEGSSAAFEGGSLNFGVRPAGSYYVSAYDPKLKCNGRMPGDVTVIMDSLPKVFNTQICYPICEGSTTGTVCLDSSQFARSKSYQYVLQRQEGTEWKDFNKYILGTGSPLVWNNITTGVYRIKAVDMQTKCDVLMDGVVDLSVHPNPEQCNLVQYQGDTAYCADRNINVSMRMNIACFTAGQTYTLVKDNVVTDQVRWDNSGWQNLKEGVYAVVIKNEWGCADTTNSIRIHNYSLPAKKSVGEDRLFCADDVKSGESTWLTIENVDSDIEYAFWRMGEKEAFEKVYKTTLLSYLNTEVSLSDADYYVVATDPSTGCSAVMKDTVRVRGSQLELSHDPVTINRTETLVKLNLTVKNAIGGIKVNWEPKAQVKDVSDILHPWVDMTDLTKDKFVVTVADSVCVKTDTIIVSQEGQALTAKIKNSVAENRFERDTLWICEGASYSLTGEILGGKSPFSYEWRIDGKVIGNGTKLTNAVAEKSGNIVFRVGSNGRVASDTIRLELYPAPGTGLNVDVPDLCVYPGDALEVDLTNTKPGVTYTLEYSKNSDVFKSTGVSAVGGVGGSLALRLPFTENEAGYYRVKATYGYNGTTCNSWHGETKVGVGVYNAAFHGGGEYCFRSEPDSLVLDSTVVGATYELIYKASAAGGYTRYSFAGAVAGDGDSLFFTGNFADGTYRVIAERKNSGCVDTLPGKAVVKHLSKPNAGTLISDQMEYCLTDDNDLKVTIALSSASAGNVYRLYRQNGSSVELLDTEIGNGGSITFGHEFDKRGRYFSVADNGSCLDTAGYVLIGKLPENEVNIAKADTGYCSGNTQDAVSLSLYSVGSDVHFYLYSSSGRWPVAEFTVFDEDTVRYQGRLGSGKYTVKAEIAECKKTVGEFVVEEYDLPEDVDILSPESSCEGTALTMGVKASQRNVLYELYYSKTPKQSDLKASAYGDGKDLQLWKDSVAGTYEIFARDTVTGCVRELSAYNVIPLPKNFDFFATDTVYCAFDKESGTQLALSGTESDVVYILQSYNETSGEFEDVRPQASIMGFGESAEAYFSGVYKAGKYRVRTTACTGSLVGKVLEIKELALPVDTLAVEVAGNGCVDSTMTVTVKKTETGIKYSLWAGDTQVKSSLTGNGANLSWKVDTARQETYFVRAERVGATASACALDLNRRIEVSTLPVMQQLSGDASICRYTTTALKLSIAEDDVKYTLHNSLTDKQVMAGTVNKVNVAFEGVTPGSYYAVAMRGDCKAVSPVHTIDSIDVPEIGDVTVDYTACTEQKAGTIRIQNMVDTLVYVLTYPGNQKKEEFRRVGINATKTIEKLDIGDYYLQVQDETTQCLSLKDTLRLYQAVPAGDTLTGRFGYCIASSRGAQLTLGHSTMGVAYMIIKETSGDTVEQIYGGIGQSFQKAYPQGQYRLVAERQAPYGGCRLSQSFEVKGYVAPALTERLALKETGALCAGNEYHISVLGARDTIHYLLYKGKTPIDTVNGNGTLDFKAIREAGDYTVIPKTGGICGSKALDTLFHINTLPADIRVEQPCSYCNPADSTGDFGAFLKIYGTVNKVRYVLNDSTASVDTLYGDYSQSSQEFRKMPAGAYTIVATDTVTGCSKVVGTAEIVKNIEPKRFVCGTDGKRCERDSASVEMNDSESNVSYYLHRDGKKVAGPIVGADGASLSFGNQKEAGVYRILAVGKSGCSVYMKDSVVVYPALIEDTLIVKGGYCEKGESNINFRLRKQTPYWRYYVLNAGNNASSDTLTGGENTVLAWTEIGGEAIRSGNFRLYAMNPCGDVQLMDTVAVDTNGLPEKYLIMEGNFTVCAGDSGTITLPASQTIVEYDLRFRAKDGRERLLATKAGTGSKLLLAGVTEAGEYIVIGRMKATGCFDTVAVAKVEVMDGIENPGVSGAEVCLSKDPGGELEVTLARKQDEVSYYLQHIHESDTLLVDSIKWGVSGSGPIKSFKPQTAEGIYRVVAQGPSCKKEFGAGRVGKNADNQAMDPAGKASICGGNAYEVALKGSQIGVEYEIFTLDKHYYDDGYEEKTMNIVAEGTGSALTIGKLQNPGLYVVKAKNGCETWMSDTLNLEVREAYEVNLRAGGYTICAGDSVRIEIVGKTVPVENAGYEIYAPGATLYSEFVNAGDKGASVYSQKWYKEPGYYRVKVVDFSDCPKEDSVEIRIVPLPEVHDLALRGNKFLCNHQTKKEIAVEGAQTGVDYYLYRKGETAHVTMKTAKSSDTDITFDVYQEGEYYVIGRYNDKGGNTCPVLMNGEVEVAPVSIPQYAVESVRDIYCDFLPGDRGAVKLQKADVNVEYQLYKDGSAYGDPKTVSVAGDSLVWSGLPGGVPKMAAELQDKPVKYTVRATDLLTGCTAEMNGVVDIIAEREITFDAKQFQNATLPGCLGSKLTIAVLAYGGRIDYRWMKAGDTLANGRQYYYTKDSLTQEDIGFYSCSMTNTCGTVTTPEVEVAPALLVEKADTVDNTIVICNLKAGEVVQKTISSSVTQAETWEWYKDGVLLSRSGEEVHRWLDINVTRDTGAGVYTCRASNDCGSVWDTCIVIVDSTPRLELEAPVHRDTLCEGSSWELRVKTDHPVSWLRGVQRQSYIGDTLRIDSVTKDDEGAYFVVCDNRCGVKKEEVALLVVDKPVRIISEHDRFYICRQSGELPYMFIQTEPRERVYYRWEDLDGNVLSTTNELNNVDLKKYVGLVDTFRVHYGNKCQDSYKDIALVTSDKIQFREPVKEIAICVEDMLQDTVLRVGVENGQQVTYRWYKVNRKDPNALRDSVGETDTLKINLGKTLYAGYYYCYMANQCVDTVSQMVSVRIDTLPEVLLRLPSRDTLCDGSQMKLKVSARAGDGSVYYGWYIRKKDGQVQKIDSVMNFGYSECEYTCVVDTTYDGARIWCNISTACSASSADTLLLTVLPSPKVSMTPLAAWNCEGTTNEIYVRMEKGDGPWKYRYSLNEQENKTVYSVTGEVDTLKVTEAGTYRIYWLQDSKCEMKGKELAKTEFQRLRISKYSLEAVDYSDPVCPGTEVALKVTVTGGVPGPWNIGIYRKSDGELASELGFEGMEYTADSILTRNVSLLKDEAYFAKVENIYGQANCVAEALDKGVELSVIGKPEITVNELKAEDRIVSACHNVSLSSLFNVQPTDGGWYVIGNQQLSGDWLMNPEQKKYTVGYRIYKDGCQFDGYNLGDIEFRPKPELTMDVTSHALCGSDMVSKVVLKAAGEYPVKVIYRILDEHDNGRLSLQSTPDCSLASAKDSVELSFGYEKNLAGKIIEVLRVEDKFGCLMDSASVVRCKDTILFPARPEYDVYTRLTGAVAWTETKDTSYRIRKGESVDIRVDLKKGQLPWMIVFGDAAFNNGFQRRNIPVATFDTVLRKPGLYEIDADDRYCSTDMFKTKPYVMVSVIDTAFLSLKAYLQGPWDGTAGKMVSSVLDRIDKRGLAAWPNVGGRKIIDWVEVELWDNKTTQLWDSLPCLLLDDGTIVDTEGRSVLRVIGKTNAMEFRIAVRCRNHLAVWSKAVDLSDAELGNPYKVDFTTVSAYETDVEKYAYLDKSGFVFLYAGEVNANSLITSFDPNRVTREKLSLLELQKTGDDLMLDVNYNGKIEWPGYNASSDIFDWSLMYKNRLKYSMVPERKIKW